MDINKQTNAKTRRLEARITPDQRELIQLQLSVRDQQAFYEFCHNNTPKPNSKLKAALKLYEKEVDGDC